MTLEESAQLMNDQTFRGRVKVAALIYAQYINLQGGNSVSRSRWAQTTMQQPDGAAQILTPGVVINPNVQNVGAGVTDADLTAAVQYVADAMM